MLGLHPVSAAPVSSLLTFRALMRAAVTMYANPTYIIYFATKDFITKATDRPAGTPIEGTLVRALHIQRSILGGARVGRLQSGLANVEIIAADGSKDDLVDRYRPGGRTFTLKVLEEGDAYADAYVLFEGVGVRWSVTRDRLTIVVSDNSYRLEVPPQTSQYAGTGGLEGGTDLTGKYRPRALGYCNNIQGALVIPGEGLFDLNDGAINAVTAAYDRGSELTLDADYATTALLRAATIDAGEYGTCVAEGRARLGGTAFGQVTFDVEGDKTSGTFVSTTADIINLLLTTATDLDSDEIDSNSFAVVNTAQPAPVGYYIPPESTETVAECVEKLMTGIGGWAGCRLRGKFGIGVLLAPDDDATPSFIYQEDEGDIITIDRQPLPTDLTPMPTNFLVAYDRNWTKQDDLAGSVTEEDPARAAYLKQDYRLAGPTTPLVLETGQKQKELTIESYFRDAADAIDEADRLMTLWRSGYTLYTYKVKDHVFMHEIGDAPKVTHSRFGLDAGRALRNVSVNDDTENNVAEIVGLG